jgi:metallo-beta-lactamase family protein
VIDVDEGLSIRFTDAGHLLGSSSIECFLCEEGKQVTIVFSGDVGNTNQPIINDPCPVKSADYAMIESTYGARLHDRAIDPIPFLVQILRKTFARNGTVIIPSFAVGRTQEMLYFFREIKMRNLLPERPDFQVYLDSPLATQATGVFLQCDTDCLDEEARSIMRAGENPIWFEGLNITETADESKALNAIREPKVIIASSGMCEGGRVLHHLKQIVTDPWNIILIVGFQAENTLGRRIVEKRNPLRILGEEIPLNARVEVINALSAHADRAGLMDWIGEVKDNVRHAFAVHGEPEKVAAMADILKEHGIRNVVAPMPGQTYQFE